MYAVGQCPVLESLPLSDAVTSSAVEKPQPISRWGQEKGDYGKFLSIIDRHLKAALLVPWRAASTFSVTLG